ncbi:MAG: hypothetical protein NT099_05900 [Candidatus Saganbacteria bacterium]|nr:hypothetical protein [Candidatus Saganbacteria bacterium]
MIFNVRLFLLGALVFLFEILIFNRIPFLGRLELFLVFIILLAFYGHLWEAFALALLVGFFQDIYACGFFFYLFLYPLLLVLTKGAQDLVTSEDQSTPHIFVALFSFVFYLLGVLALAFVFKFPFPGIGAFFFAVLVSFGNVFFSFLYMYWFGGLLKKC